MPIDLLATAVGAAGMVDAMMLRTGSRRRDARGNCDDSESTSEVGS